MHFETLGKVVIFSRGESEIFSSFSPLGASLSFSQKDIQKGEFVISFCLCSLSCRVFLRSHLSTATYVLILCFFYVNGNGKGALLISKEKTTYSFCAQINDLRTNKKVCFLSLHCLFAVLSFLLCVSVGCLLYWVLSVEFCRSSASFCLYFFDLCFLQCSICYLNCCFLCFVQCSICYI